MGEYAFYVYGSYAVAFALYGGLVLWTWVKKS